MCFPLDAWRSGRGSRNRIGDIVFVCEHTYPSAYDRADLAIGSSNTPCRWRNSVQPAALALRGIPLCRSCGWKRTDGEVKPNRLAHERF